MKRITDLERKYVLEALDNEFCTSKNVAVTPCPVVESR